MTMNVDVSLDTTSCSLVTGYGRFRAVFQSKLMLPSSAYTVMTIYPDEGVPLKHHWTATKRYSMTPQKTVIWIHRYFVLLNLYVLVLQDRLEQVSTLAVLNAKGQPLSRITSSLSARWSSLLHCRINAAYQSAERAPQSLPVPANDLPAETEHPYGGLFFDKNNLWTIGPVPI